MSHLYPLTQVGEVSIFGKGAVDAKVAGTVVLGKPPTRAVPIALLVNLDDADDLVSQATISVGTDGPIYANIGVATTLTGLVVTKGFVFVHTNPLVGIVLPSDDLRLNIIVPATATVARIGVWVVGVLR